MNEPPSQSVSQFDEALRLHQSGHLAEAEVAYLQILAAQPDHSGAIHLLGVICQQQGRHQEALELIGRAIARLPDKAVYRNNYGAAFFALGRHAEALRRLQTTPPRLAQSIFLPEVRRLGLTCKPMMTRSLRKTRSTLRST